MKKFLLIVLALILVFSFASCKMNDSAAKVKADYEKYDWNNASDSEAKSEAKVLIDRISKLPASEQRELQDIKNELEKIVNGNMDPTPSPTVTPTPTESPTLSPGVTPTPATTPTPTATDTTTNNCC